VCIAGYACLGGAHGLKVVAQEGTEPNHPGRHRPRGRAVRGPVPRHRTDRAQRAVSRRPAMKPPRAASELASHQHDALCAVQREGARASIVPRAGLSSCATMIARADDTAAINSWDDVQAGRQHILTNRGYCGRTCWIASAACRSMPAPPSPPTCKADCRTRPPLPAPRARHARLYRARRAPEGQSCRP
jgi:hypothetical protein